MPKVANFVSLGRILIDPNSAVPLHRQLYEALRSDILSGKLRPGMRLPSTRALAKELSMSRNTVSNAFNQLLTEGYVESKTGSGTRVTSTLPEEILHVEFGPALPAQRRLNAQSTPPVKLSERGEAILKIPHDWELERSASFNSASPSVIEFPNKEWERLLVSCWRELKLHELGYRSAMGYLPLREALVDYLSTVRGVNCSAENILITNGAQQAVTITANLLLNRGDPVWVENPCYAGVRAALSGALAKVVPVPVDADGLDVEAGKRLAPKARLVYVSPSHQYPLGVTMSLTRRLNLLQWAEETQAWIVEDDYDSEFRYTGYPVPAVQGLDQNGRVIYVGTFSKVLFPALRIGYVVLPTPLIAPFHAARAHADRGSPLLEQAVLAKFIANGHLGRHTRRMRTHYAERQAMLMEALRTQFGDTLVTSGMDAGLHLVMQLPPRVDDAAVSAELAQHNITAPPLSSFALKPLKKSGLVLGFAAVPEHELAESVAKLSQIVRTFI